MPTSQLRRIGKVLRRAVNDWVAARRDHRQAEKRRLLFEPLEMRALLASDLGEISGRIFKDVTGNGYTVGEEVSGASVQLYLDDGDGTFEPGTGDTLQTTTTSNASGLYSFDRLTAGNYWVNQPAQVVGPVSLNQQTSALIAITSLEAQGVLGTDIDSFVSLGPNITASASIGATAQGAQSFVPPSEVLGDERDLFCEITGDPLTFTVLDSIDLVAGVGRLDWGGSTGATGRYVASWDGTDGDGSTLAQGLPNIDLTDAGASQFIRMAVFGTDKPNATAQLRIYSSATNFSLSPLMSIPQVPSSTGEILFDYSALTVGGGTGANLTNVTAIELEIIANEAAMQGQVNYLGAIGPSVETQNFSNFEEADLSVTKTVNNATPNLGQSVIFTVSVTNNGPNAATNVAVSDTLPAGMTFVSSNPSQGTYNSGTGSWSVGSLAVSQTATLQITATVTSVGAKTNTAQVSASDQFDPDSTPGNSIATEDDQASAQLTPQAIDLSLTKTVNDSTPDKNQNVTFTISLSNAGPSTGTNIVVQDVLPAGMTFVSSTPSQGSYSSATGLWTVGTVAASGSASLDIVATVTTSGAKTNTAQVTAADQTDIDSTPNNNNAAEDDQSSVTLTPNVADLRVSKTVNDATPDRNENVTFTVTVTNDGPNSATNVAVLDQLPAGLTFVSSTPSQGSYVNGTGIWTVGTLTNGGSATLQIVATVATSGAKTNTAQVSSSDQFDPDSTPNNSISTEDDQASAIVTPNVIDLSITKTVNNSTPFLNDNIIFTIALANAGPTTATGVTVADQLPAGLTFVSSTPSQGTYDNTTGIWTVGSLNSGSTVNLQVTATVSSTVVSTNTAQVNAANQFDIDSTPGNSIATEDDQSSVTITPQRRLTKRLFLAE